MRLALVFAAVLLAPRSGVTAEICAPVDLGAVRQESTSRLIHFTDTNLVVDPRRVSVSPDGRAWRCVEGDRITRLLLPRQST